MKDTLGTIGVVCLALAALLGTAIVAFQYGEARGYERGYAQGRGDWSKSPCLKEYR